MHRADKRNRFEAKLLQAHFAAWLLGASWAQAAEFSWTMQAFQPADSMPALEFQSFAERLEGSSDGRIDIEVLAAGTLVPNDETPRAINAGLLQGHYSTPSFFANLDPAFAVLGDSLAAYEDPKQRDGWFYEGGGLELSRKLYATNGLYFIGPVYWPADWMPSIVPLTDVTDLKGLRIRAPTGLVGDLLRRAGADVMALPASQTYDALANGTIDATDWANVSLNQTSGLNEVAPFNTLIRHSMVVTEISVGMAEWNALPAELKAVVEKEVRSFSDRIAAAFAAEQTAVLDEIAAEGITSAEWGKDEAAEFRRMLFDVWGNWREKSALAAEIIDSQRAYLQGIESQ